MPVYAKKVSTGDKRFAGRQIQIISTEAYSAIPIPDSEVLCNGCNKNVAEEEEKSGFLIYLSKRELDKDQPYDLYCGSCRQSYFPKAIMV